MTSEIRAQLADPAALPISTLREWAKQYKVDGRGSKAAIAGRIVEALGVKSAKVKGAGKAVVKAAAKTPRKVRMEVVRKDGTKRMTNWITTDNARAFAQDALGKGDYQSAQIEVEGEWIPVTI